MLAMPGPAMPCMHAMAGPAMPRLACLPCHVMPCDLASPGRMPCHAMLGLASHAMVGHAMTLYLAGRNQLL